MSLRATVRGDGPSILLLHGLFGSGGNLGGLGRHLSEHWSVHQLDLPNHGRSPWTTSLRLEDIARAIGDYAEQVGEPYALVGHSLGGKVAMQLALQWPAQVKGLVVADIAPVTYAPSHGAVFEAIRAVEQAAVRSREEALEILTTRLHEETVRQFLLLSLARDDEGIYRWRFNHELLEAQYDEVRAAPQGSAVNVPTLFVYGDASDYVDAQGRAAAESLFPHARFAVIAGTGHWLHAQKPDSFNRIVAEFLQSLSGASGVTL